MKKILYYILVFIWFTFSLLPFKILYLLSDFLYFLCYYCIRYRRKVVRKNLLNSFPDKNLEEIIKIEKGFYSFFGDYIVETIKLFSITEKNMRKRMTFSGWEEVNKTIADGNSCIVYLGHYCNWEWITSLPLYLDSNIQAGQIYHVLENEIFDKLFLKLRGRFDSESISMKNTLRRIITMRQENKQFIIGFIADQTPHWNSIHLWMDFLHQDTPVFTGTERIAKQVNSSVFYLEMSRLKRGYYHAEFKLLTEHPKEMEEYELTKLYMHELEKTIKRAPQFWLWSHNRWKRQRK